MDKETPNSVNSMQEPSVVLFIKSLNGLLEEEEFKYCFYDFKREKIKEKTQMYTIIEKCKHDNNYMKHFCDEINRQLLKYDITSIINIIYGKTYRYPNRIDIPIQIHNGYYYSFTIVCKKKAI